MQFNWSLFRDRINCFHCFHFSSFIDLPCKVCDYFQSQFIAFFDLQWPIKFHWNNIHCEWERCKWEECLLFLQLFIDYDSRVCYVVNCNFFLLFLYKNLLNEFVDNSFSLLPLHRSLFFIYLAVIRLHLGSYFVLNISGFCKKKLFTRMCECINKESSP